MKITQREHRGILVLDLVGKLEGSVGSGGLAENALRRFVDRSSAAPRLLLNLAGCSGADSLGIGELISLHVSLTNRGGTLKLVHLPEPIAELLRATQLISMFAVFGDETAALRSFG